MTTIRRYEFEALQVIGYMEPTASLTVPVPVTPVYRARHEPGTIVVPLRTESGGVFYSGQLTPKELCRLVCRGAVTRLDRVRAAKPDHFLWVDCSLMPHYCHVGRSQLLRLARARRNAVWDAFQARDFSLPQDTNEMQVAALYLAEVVGDVVMVQDYLDPDDRALVQRLLDHWVKEPAGDDG